MTEQAGRSTGRAGAVALALGVVALLLIPIAWERWDALQARQTTHEAVAAHVARAAEAADAALFDEAAAALEAARDLAPSDPVVQQARMNLRVRTAAEAPALPAPSDAALRYALEVTGRDGARAGVAAGRLDLAAGRLSEARERLEAAVEADASYAPAHLALGDLARREGRLVEARGAFERAAELQPDSLRARNNLGVVYLALERTDEAVAAFEAAIEAEDNAASRLNLANALLAAGRAPEAAAHLRRAAELQPGSAEIQRRLGAVLQDQGDLPGAEAALRRALELDRTPATAFALGLVLQGQERFTAAAELLRQVVDAEPRNADAAYQLGATLQAAGAPEAAVQALRRYLRLTLGDPSEAERRAQVEAALSPPER